MHWNRIFLNKIDILQTNLEISHCDSNYYISIVTDHAKQQMTGILETKLKGILIRSKADYIEGAEKNAKCFN